MDGYKSSNHFILNGDSKLVQHMVCYLEEILATRAAKSIFPSFQTIFDTLSDKITDVQCQPYLIKGIKKKWVKQLEWLHDELESYLSTLSVLGFNSARCDLNLICEFLHPVLSQMGDIKVMIKKAISYQCIHTESLKFIHITNYLAPGYNYRQFLNVYGAEVSKVSVLHKWVERTWGVKWNVETDQLGFNSQKVNKNPTWRNILLIMGSIYDPLGMVVPYVLIAKAILCRKLTALNRDVKSDLCKTRELCYGCLKMEHEKTMQKTWQVRS